MMLRQLVMVNCALRFDSELSGAEDQQVPMKFGSVGLNGEVKVDHTHSWAAALTCLTSRE